MRRAMNGIQRRIESLIADAKGLLSRVRARRPWLDHHVRALKRYQERRGDRLAAALTCYAFLSFFPLLALAYALLGYVVGISEQARDYFVRAVNSLLPGLSGDIRVEEIAQSKTTVGVLGLAALLITGQNWMQVLRESLRDIWGNEPTGGGNYVVKRLWDVGVLAFLGVTLICGIAVSSVTTSATSTVLGWVGLQDVTGAGTGLRLLSLACAVTFNTVIFLVLFSRLSGTRAPWRGILRGALFGAVGFEALKQVAALLLSRVTENPVYGTFAVLVGLMVWINLASRFMLFVAAWTATRRVVLTADADDPENIADPDAVPAPADARETAGEDASAPDREAAARDPKAQEHEVQGREVQEREALEEKARDAKAPTAP